MQFATKIEENRDTLQAIIRRLDVMEANMFTQEQGEALCAQHYKMQKKRLKSQFTQLRESLTQIQEEKRYHAIWSCRSCVGNEIATLR